MLTEAVTKARERGLQESLQLGKEIARARVARLSDGGRQVFVFLSPPLNNSGAPQVLMQVVSEFADRYGSESVRLLAPPAQGVPQHRDEVNGVKVERAAEVLSPALVRLQLALRKDDFVLLNTVAVSRNYLDVILASLQAGRLSHAYWYIHEDVDQLPVLARFLLQPEPQLTIRRLMAQGQLTVLVPSKKVKREYDTLFGSAEVRILPFKISADGQNTAPRSAAHYSSVRFLLSGKPTDGRKGHMVAMAAFHEFMKTHYEDNPAIYRKFTLTLVGMTDDYISEQIRLVGSTVLGDRLKILSVISHEEALEVTRDCNAVICCSFNEALPLNVIEGMRRGHIVLRNDSGGMEEQLTDGVNGFQIDSTDVRQFARVLERVLNTRTMPDSRLQAMGRASLDLVGRLHIPSYVDALTRAREAGR